MTVNSRRRTGCEMLATGSWMYSCTTSSPLRVLSGPIAPIEPILARLDPAVARPRVLSDQQLDALVAFVRDGLLDPRAKPEKLRRLVPDTLPSGRRPLTFEFSGR